MNLQSSDITYLLSGGDSNIKPLGSLGGGPSSQSLGTYLNNLFPSFSNKSSPGSVYRCIYVKNTHSSGHLMDLKVYLSEEAGASLGIQVRDEVQWIVLSGDPVGGTFSIAYTAFDGTQEITSDIEWVPTLSAMESRIEEALNGLAYLSDVVVTASRDGDYIYQVNFTGLDGGRRHEALSIASSDFYGSVSFDVVVRQTGSPMNAVAPSIGVENQAPIGVSFASPDTLAEAIEVGDLGPGEFFPVWLLRTTTQSDIDAMTESATDSLALKLSGVAFDAAVL